MNNVESTQNDASTHSATEPAGPPQPRSDTPLADEIGEAIAEARRSLGYVARNMSTAFDGALTHIEANAHCALVEALGHLTTLEELGARVHYNEDRMAWHTRASVAPARARTAAPYAEHLASDLDIIEAALAEAECAISGNGTRAIHRAQDATAGIRHTIALMRGETGEEAAS